MTIRRILVSALRRIGREELAADVEDGGDPAGEGGEVVQTLLYCINAVEDELARYYFPLKCTQTLSSENGLFEFSKFSHTPVKILGAEHSGKKVQYELLPDGLSAKCGTLAVTYFYVPPQKTIEDDSAFGCLGDGEITSLGAAAEYCLICGEASLAEVWETRYREAIDRAQKLNGRSVYVPPRRWV